MGRQTARRRPPHHCITPKTRTLYTCVRDVYDGKHYTKKTLKTIRTYSVMSIPSSRNVYVETRIYIEKPHMHHIWDYAIVFDFFIRRWVLFIICIYRWRGMIIIHATRESLYVTEKDRMAVVSRCRQVYAYYMFDSFSLYLHEKDVDRGELNTIAFARMCIVTLFSPVSFRGVSLLVNVDWRAMMLCVCKLYMFVTLTILWLYIHSINKFCLWTCGLHEKIYCCWICNRCNGRHGVLCRPFVHKVDGKMLIFCIV